MAHTITSISAVTMLMFTLGCGSSDESSRSVSAWDVSHLPPGDAVGASFSGVYQLRGGQIVDCDCRVGFCSRWHVNNGDLFTLTQTDGALHVLLHSVTNTTDQGYDGGINRGGDFRVGSSFVSGDNTSYVLLSGQVVTGVSIEGAESRFTYVGNVGGDDFDCDVTGQLNISYLKPL